MPGSSGSQLPKLSVRYTGTIPKFCVQRKKETKQVKSMVSGEVVALSHEERESRES